MQRYIGSTDNEIKKDFDTASMHYFSTSKTKSKEVESVSCTRLTPLRLILVFGFFALCMLFSGPLLAVFGTVSPKEQSAISSKVNEIDDDKDEESSILSNHNQVDPEDITKGSELDIEHIWGPANAAIMKKMDIGHGVGLYTKPEMKKSAVIELNGKEVKVLQESKQPAVLVFYADWCGHCAHYAPIYDKIARHFVSKYDLIFTAVNCAKWNTVCDNNKIEAYPTVKVINMKYKYTSKDSVLGLKNFVSKHANLRKKSSRSSAAAALAGSAKAGGLFEHWLQQRQSARAHVAKPLERLQDGIASLKFLLADELATALTQVKLDAGIHIVELVLKYAPKNEPSISGDIDVLTQVKLYLEGLSNKQFFPKATIIRMDITKLFGEKKWHWHVCGVKGNSAVSTEGDVGHSFTCGLWQLFHFLSVAGSSSNYEHAPNELSLKPAAEIEAVIHDVIEHAFSCTVCKENFLKEYKSCAFGRCTVKIIKNNDLDPFLRIQMWLFKLHNGVSTRLFDELEAGPQEERDKALWPDQSVAKYTTLDMINQVRSAYWDSNNWGRLKPVNESVNILH
jgi:thiol-disulfide isomerase/thioredoxin